MRLRGLFVAVAVLGCRPPAQPETWTEGAGFRSRALTVPARGASGFARIAATTTGIEFMNTVSDSVLLHNRILAQGAGVALGDVDGDGLVDVFLARTEGPNVLYRNRGGWKFEDITAAAGVAAPERYSSGAALADIEGDGDLDLILLAIGSPTSIFVNDGAGKFTEQRRELGLVETSVGGTTPTMADVDGDGDLDLYLANYKGYTATDSVAPQLRAFNQVVREIGPNRFEVLPQYQRDFKAVSRPEQGGVGLIERADPDHFYLNEGGRFVATPIRGDRFRDERGVPLTEEPEWFGLGAQFGDLNGDGAPDLYVANDFQDPDEFWLNDGTGRFQLAPWNAQRQTSNSGMAVDIGDVNGDGRPDLYEVDMLGNDTRRLKTQMPTHSAVRKKPGDLETRIQMQRNKLFLNRGDGTFGEVAEYAGVEASGWSWSTMFMDVDLDGWQDILIATGHTWDVMDADTQEKLQNRLNDVQWQRQRWEFPRLALKNVAYRNKGDLTYEDVSEKWGFGVEDDITHAMAAADLDGDGDLDMVLNRLGSPALVLRNEASAPRVAVRLVGDAPNTRAVGAKIRVIGGAPHPQEREVSVGGRYLSHGDYLATFATGVAATVTIVVDWRDGRRSVIASAAPNRLYEITTASATGRVPADSLGFRPVVAMFEDHTAVLRGHQHAEPAYDDWSRQFLLPNALSQLGPGVTWFDVDRDGDEDLVIGTGRGGRPALFRNDRGTLSPVPGGPVAAADWTTILGVPGALGRTRLIAGVASWEARNEGEVASWPSAVELEMAGARLPAADAVLSRPNGSSTGPLAAADYDGDGDLDLFVGGRAVPARYPTSASSRLLRNDGGQFVADEAAAPLLEGIGMVSAATFADLDGDGDEDLLLAREWGSVVLAINEGGRFSRAPGSWGLDGRQSRWNGVATGDLDGDGRLDIVATSWGRNTVASADTLHPLVMLFGAFGNQGATEMLMAHWDARLGGLAPLNSYARVRVAIPAVVDRARTFGAYADLTVDSLLGPLAKEAGRIGANTLDHTVFFNRGSRFEARSLPAESQFAPASYAGIADFDGDGTEDVFLSQNFFPTEIGSPRYDDGRSLLLIGDGRDGLRAVPGHQSGLLVYGDQRGAGYADFDGDGRLDLAVSQNGAATRLFRNRGAKVGLRVRVAGPVGNPDGIGVQLRLVYAGRQGPVRQIQAGSGYWSQNGAVQVLGLSGVATKVWARWPGGRVTEVAVPAGATEVVVR